MSPFITGKFIFKKSKGIKSELSENIILKNTLLPTNIENHLQRNEPNVIIKTHAICR